jgi:hypothetical protein
VFINITDIPEKSEDNLRLIHANYNRPLDNLLNK